jgi:gamma-glutamylputrescine oxidase
MISARWSGWEYLDFQNKFDVVIVGGGYSGLWIACDLRKAYPHYRIAVLERNVAGAAASSKNAGFACAGSASEVLADVDRMGFDRATELLHMRLQGIERIRNHFSDVNIGYEAVGGWEVFPEAMRAVYEGVLERSAELEEINRSARGRWIQLMPKQTPELRSREKLHWVGHPAEGGLNPLKLLRQLEKKAHRAGVAIFRGVDVMAFNENSHGIDLNTSMGPVIADRVILTTNGAASQLVPEIGVQPARAQVLLTEPLPDLAFRGVFHRDEGYYYFRNVGNRVLIGGARNEDFPGETTMEMGTSARIQEALERVLREEILAGQDYVVAHRWSGLMGMPSQRVPVQRWVSNRIYASVGLGGMGVALAPMHALSAVADFKKA